jgi:hypothetical protein
MADQFELPLIRCMKIRLINFLVLFLWFDVAMSEVLFTGIEYAQPRNNEELTINQCLIGTYDGAKFVCTVDSNITADELPIQLDPPGHLIVIQKN